MLLRTAPVVVMLLLCAAAQASAAFTSRLPGDHLQVRSQQRGDQLNAQADGMVPYGFVQVAAALTRPQAWCEILPLTLNIKACAYRAKQDSAGLEVYAGRKYYQTPDQSYRLSYTFRIEARNHDRFVVLLQAQDGPLGTSDYRIRLEGRRRGTHTLLHIGSSYRTSFLSNLATRTYLATLGRGKTGFSRVDHGDGPADVEGVQGIIERNAVRYYLALEAFLAAQPLPPGQRFERRIEIWFALTERYPQLHEMDRQEYLQAKRAEWANQARLQQSVAQEQLAAEKVRG